ncbi:MAG: hypothetical protein NVS3B1_28040 [Marmoricola sp.]
MTQTAYEFLDSVQERERLIGLEPQAVLANAHRIYDWMIEQGVDQDSFLRELAFDKASEALGIEYSVLYDAWLNETPVAS